MTLSTPIGPLGATYDGAGRLTRLHWDCGGEVGEELGRQLDEYFAGARRSFDVPLAPVGTPWQRAVWAALREIPYGETITYTELAARAGRPGAARAAGAANGRNPIAILIPCHRVIGTGGSLTGYAGGVDAKARLIALERGARSPASSPGSPPPRTTGRRARPAA